MTSRQPCYGYLALGIFVVAYILVILEETTQLRKSKPVLLAAGLIWALIGMAYAAASMGDKAEEAAQHVIMEYGELFLFLLVAITYVNTLEERRVFDVLRVKLTGKKLSYRNLFWLTGTLAFFLSGVLDNLTTALVMGAVVLAIGREFAEIRRHWLSSTLSWRQMPAGPSRPSATSRPSWSGRRTRSRSSNSSCCSFLHW